ncbi:MAG: 50S ribosomal protein L11 methyltransferase [Clostridiales bacterium]|nr:50S ribosomal protein L11 methyltransferase [Clostridiales bacterium]
MDWIEVTIKTTSQGIDMISQILYDVGVKGVIIEDPSDIEAFASEPGDWDYVDEGLLSDLTEDVLVRGYLEKDDALHDRLQYIRQTVRDIIKDVSSMDIGPGEVELVAVSENDWASSWKSYFKPRKVGKKIVIKPTWEEYAGKNEEVIIEIDPGMAFGTGTHETTILCMEMLEKYIKEQDIVLDIGCGTGILSILGILLGANRALAVDIDKNAVDIAKENAKINYVEDKLEVVHGDLFGSVEGQFDIIVSNIIADVIIEISQDIDKFMKNSGLFIASGIILDRLKDVKQALDKSGLNIIECITLGEWAVVVSRYE